MKKKLSLLYIFSLRVCLSFAQDTVSQTKHGFQNPPTAHTADTAQQIENGRVNRPGVEQKPYVILISADGFRDDLADKYQAKNLLALRDKGVKAEYLEASFPSLTFPNHYTIVTGLYPGHHGLVDNNFYDTAKKQTYSLGTSWTVRDSSWYGGTPLWTLAEKEGMLTASFYWVGSEAAIGGIRPTYYYKYNTLISLPDRINDVKNWLLLPEEKRPHLIFFYLSDVDHQEHLHTPDSRETEAAVHSVDEGIGTLVSTLEALHLPINYIFLSDHGMTAIDTLNTLPLPLALDTTQFRAMNSQTLVHLYAKYPASVAATVIALKAQAENYDVFANADIPAKFHYGGTDDVYNRVGDIVLIAHAPKVFNFRDKAPNPATHGYDPAMPEMRATFYAWGPAFRSHLTIPGFENVHVFPLITHILGLSFKDPIDGRFKVLKKTLK